jgi:uncharacterized phiE125 gp8 family phage protein
MGHRRQLKTTYLPKIRTTPRQYAEAFLLAHAIHTYMANFYWNKPVHQSRQLVTPPAVEPVTLSDLPKVHIRIDSDITEEDDLLESMIVAARVHCESYSRRAFITQVWDFYLDAFPFWWTRSTIGPAITLIKAPVQTVQYVKYLDQGGNLVPLDASLYTVDTASEPGRIIRNNLQPWPIVGFIPNAVTVRLTCGYGDSGDDVPSPIRQAILMHTAWQYRNRGDQDNATVPPAAIYSLLDSVGFGGYW